MWRLENGNGLWQQMLRTKYLNKETLSQCESKAGQSHFWHGLMQVKDVYNQFSRKVVGNGKNVLFWEDIWLGNEPFSVKYYRLFNISLNHGITVADALQGGCQHMTFRRNFTPETYRLWEDLKALCSQIELGTHADSSRWLLEKNGQFSVKSFYNVLAVKQVDFPFKYFWKIKLPLKIKVFMWLIDKNSILTRDNLLHRGWQGPKECVFCGNDESIDHLFLHCPLLLSLFGGWLVAHLAYPHFLYPCLLYILGLTLSMGIVDRF